MFTSRKFTEKKRQKQKQEKKKKTQKPYHAFTLQFIFLFFVALSLNDDFSLHRCHRSCRFDKPVWQKQSCRHSGGHNNLAFDGDNLGLQQRGSNSLEGDKESNNGTEPEYWEIPEQEADADNNSAADDDDKGSYQKLNTANGRSDSTYDCLRH